MLLLVFVVLVAAACSPETENQEKETVELTISAASSLQDALREIKTEFEKDYPYIKINYNLASSGTLQQQILQGAPVDVFLSAAAETFDPLVEEGLIDSDQSVDLLGNEIVLIVPKGTQSEFSSFDQIVYAERIAIGTPDSVPAGIYGKEVLENVSVWEKTESSLIFAKDVRQVLTYVETNNVDAGIVYKTDALRSDKVEVAAEADEEDHTPIVYPAGVVSSGNHPKEAALFYQYIQNDKSMDLFKEYGFKDLIK
ncbi:molybdenum ABC transporter substrate-binding protein [Jeotgalibacillus campisalis]|uniref:Molybdenum ABC transporter substrate-binding protein n=1 Tax=Jeotgalibacillus campisalis TaxID=220754 RepID=A0A0C2RKU1_9BACL|nr:molybdenum ABC transporter substrate-binding protein [Jeotgalibacillus campisalis]